MVKNTTMFYEQIKDRSPAEFKRLTGVAHSTFLEMTRLVAERQPTFGRPPALSTENQVLMTLMYWREYRTQLHIGATYGVSEATVSRTIRKIEDVLIQSGRFALPGKRALTGAETTYEVVLVDATEIPIERPKKSRGATIVARRSSIP